MIAGIHLDHIAVAMEDRRDGPAMADLEFFWDPVCPWAWITSRWVQNVVAEKGIDVDWRFIALKIVNEDKGPSR